MSKITKIWLIIAASLVLVGCIIFGGVMTMLKWDFTKLSTGKYETHNYEIDEKFNNISIVTDTAENDTSNQHKGSRYNKPYLCYFTHYASSFLIKQFLIHIANFFVSIKTPFVAALHP